MTSFHVRRSLFGVALALGAAGAIVAQAPTITKVDPPNWWVGMPPAMLLVRGENLAGARFHFGDRALRVDHSTVSANGHWAQVWLAATPVHAVTSSLIVDTPGGHAGFAFRVQTRRPASDGFAGFSGRDVMYLIMPDRFADGDLNNDGPTGHSAANSAEAAAERAKPKGWHGGDLRGILAHLDYLQQLGVTTLWITPVYQNHSAVAYHGYHATDYYAVDEHYGTLADLQALASGLHARGMKLVLDMVPNHVGPYHPWVTDEPRPNWFHGTAANHLQSEYNFYGLINPHTPERDRIGTLQGWFQDVPPLPDNDTDDPAVAQYLRQNVIWWTEETGADGLRYDTFPYVNREFWHDLNFALRTLYPHLTEVGEVSDGDPLVTSAFADGVTRAGVDTGLWTPFDFPLHFALRNVFATGASMQQLADILRDDALYPHPERLVPFLDNHDLVRYMSEPGATLAGERLALATLLTTRGTPQLYSGDELALKGGEDPDNRRDFPGGFPASPGKAQPSAFDPTTRTGTQGDMFAWTAKLLALRKAQPALQSGSEEVLYTDKDTLVFTRNLRHDHVLIAIHRGNISTQVTFNTALTGLQGTSYQSTLFGSGTLLPGTMGKSGNLGLDLPENSVTIAQFSGAAAASH